MIHINKLLNIKKYKFIICFASTLILCEAPANAQATWDQTAEQQSEREELQKQIQYESNSLPVPHKTLTWGPVQLTNHTSNKKENTRLGTRRSKRINQRQFKTKYIINLGINSQKRNIFNT